MNYTDKEKTEYLEALATEQYPQGDNYYAFKLKNDLWHYGSVNDYPLQHGKGGKSTIQDKIVESLITKEKRVKKSLLCDVIDSSEITITKQEYESLKRDSDNLNKISFSM